MPPNKGYDRTDYQLQDKRYRLTIHSRDCVKKTTGSSGECSILFNELIQRPLYQPNYKGTLVGVSSFRTSPSVIATYTNSARTVNDWDDGSGSVDGDNIDYFTIKANISDYNGYNSNTTGNKMDNQQSVLGVAKPNYSLDFDDDNTEDNVVATFSLDGDGAYGKNGVWTKTLPNNLDITLHYNNDTAPAQYSYDWVLELEVVHLYTDYRPQVVN